MQPKFHSHDPYTKWAKPEETEVLRKNDVKIYHPDTWECPLCSEKISFSQGKEYIDTHTIECKKSMTDRLSGEVQKALKEKETEIESRLRAQITAEMEKKYTTPPPRTKKPTGGKKK